MPEGTPGEPPINEQASVASAEGAAPAPAAPAGESAQPETTAPAGAAAAPTDPKLAHAQRVEDARQTYIGNVRALLTQAEGLATEHNNTLLEIHSAMKDRLPEKVHAALEHLTAAKDLLDDFKLDLEEIQPKAREAKDKARGAHKIVAEVIGENSRGGREIIAFLSRLAASSSVLRATYKPHSRAKRAVRRIGLLVKNIDETILVTLPQEDLGVRPADGAGDVDTPSVADPIIESYSLGLSVITGIQRYQHRL